MWWLSPVTDLPRMDWGTVPGPSPSCRAGPSLLSFTDGEEALPGWFLKGGVKRCVMNCEQLEGRGESHRSPPAVSLGRQDLTRVWPPGASLHGSAKPVWRRHPGVQTCPPVWPQWSWRSEACLRCSALLLWLPEGPVLPGAFLLSFSLVVAHLHSSGGGVFRILRAGAQSSGWGWGVPVPGHTCRDTKDSRILHHVGGSFSGLLLWCGGVFLPRCISNADEGMEGKFPHCVPAQV